LSPRECNSLKESLSAEGEPVRRRRACPPKEEKKKIKKIKISNQNPSEFFPDFHSEDRFSRMYKNEK
jgi:hypothetical protein